MTIAYLSFGSNNGDRIGYIQQATSFLSSVENITIVRTSSFYETEPWGMNTKNWFVNAIVEIKTSLSPKELLQECLKIEEKLGRQQIKSTNYEDRTIDIDILFYSKDIINEENLTIPHQFLHLRAFTLVPLLELVPNFVHPILNKTILELHEDLDDPEMVYLYGTRVEI